MDPIDQVAFEAARAKYHAGLCCRVERCGAGFGSRGVRARRERAGPVATTADLPLLYRPESERDVVAPTRGLIDSDEP